MGGDEIYPNASQEAYSKQLRDPYDWAFPDPNPHLLKGPPVYALPGNHDWYDGLVQFLALFSRQEHLHLGGWRSHQRRSYFALQITQKWWIWAMDAQLDDDVDQPQKDYFIHIAKGMPENSNIILCGPEPGWLYTLRQGNGSLQIIDYVAWIAMNHCDGVKIPVVLSGDAIAYVASKPSPRSATKSTQTAPSSSGVKVQTCSLFFPGRNFCARSTSSWGRTVSSAASISRRSAYWPNMSDTTTLPSSLRSSPGPNQPVIRGYFAKSCSVGGGVAMHLSTSEAEAAGAFSVNFTSQIIRN